MEDIGNPPAQAVLFGRAPRAWMERYKAKGYHRFNPVHAAARRRATPFFWDDADFVSALAPEQAAFMSDMASGGVAGGFTIPIHSWGALPASCSLVPDRDGVDPANYFLGHSAAIFAHERARELLCGARADAPVLTQRERDCLILVARGKSDWAIGELLGVSEGAAHKIIERAKRKLGVATRVQAVVRALHAGAISLSDATQ
jgi:DNA-binding CsgD family transcriptional regulator